MRVLCTAYCVCDECMQAQGVCACACACACTCARVHVCSVYMCVRDVHIICTRYLVYMCPWARGHVGAWVRRGNLSDQMGVRGVACACACECAWIILRADHTFSIYIRAIREV